MQKLFLDTGNGDVKEVYVDRSWRDNGKDATYAMQGGMRVLLSEGAKPKPEIFQAGTAFFYKNGQPVTNLEDIDYLPQPYRKLAEEFVSKQGEAKKAPALPTQPIKQRGRPKKATHAEIEIKDEATYREAGGKLVD